MSAEKDISLDEKRVYAGDERKATLYVASGVGIVAVDVVDERVGGFELAASCTARDVAAGDDVVAVATDADVLVGRVGAGGDGGGDDAPVDGFAGTDHGPAVAVSVVDGTTVLAAGADGEVSRLDPDGDDDWTDCGTVGSEVRAMDGDLCAASDGVYRVGREVAHVGLDDARDVSATGTPRAATGAGLYRLGNGWLDELAGEATVVASDGGETGSVGGTGDTERPERAHAVVDDDLVALSGGDWVTYPDQPEGEVVGVAYDRTTYLVTAGGRVLAADADGWRGQSLGVPDVAGVVAVGPN